MKPREFITLSGSAAIATPLATNAQQSTIREPRIGIIDNAPNLEHSQQGLPNLGYIEGHNNVIDFSSAPGLQLRTGRFRSNAAGSARACVTAGRGYRRLRYARDARCPANGVHNSNHDDGHHDRAS